MTSLWGPWQSEQWYLGAGAREGVGRGPWLPAGVVTDLPGPEYGPDSGPAVVAAPVLTLQTHLGLVALNWDRGLGLGVLD